MHARLAHAAVLASIDSSSHIHVYAVYYSECIRLQGGAHAGCCLAGCGCSTYSGFDIRPVILLLAFDYADTLSCLKFLFSHYLNLLRELQLANGTS